MTESNQEITLHWSDVFEVPYVSCGYCNKQSCWASSGCRHCQEQFRWIKRRIKDELWFIVAVHFGTYANGTPRIGDVKTDEDRVLVRTALLYQWNGDRPKRLNEKQYIWGKPITGEDLGL